MPDDNIPVMVLRRASALNAEDNTAARAALAGTCVYHTGTGTPIGPDAIIAMYRTNGEVEFA